MIDAPSPNFNARRCAVSLIVVHYTNTKTGQDALARLRDPASEVSAHYLIDEDGTSYRLVDEGKRAWHAGRSFWRGERDVNSASVGIELVNPGHLWGYRPFPAAQIAALKELLPAIMARHKIGPAGIVGHSDVAPMRKEDPGELFPWRNLAAEGFGLWPAPMPEDAARPAAEGEVNTLLRAIGYECPEEDERAAHAALTAFQRRFHPEALMEEPGPETLAFLRALARMMG